LMTHWTGDGWNKLFWLRSFHLTFLSNFINITCEARQLANVSAGFETGQSVSIIASYIFM